MTNIVTISSNTTLGEEHEGAILRITSGVTITFPKDTTHPFQVGDTIILVSDTASSISLNAATDVTLSPNGNETLSTKGGFFFAVYVGSNEYLLWS